MVEQLMLLYLISILKELKESTQNVRHLLLSLMCLSVYYYFLRVYYSNSTWSDSVISSEATSSNNIPLQTTIKNVLRFFADETRLNSKILSFVTVCLCLGSTRSKNKQLPLRNSQTTKQKLSSKICAY